MGWVHDSGLSFRHERYPAYKATREKLTEELQSDFDSGMVRIREMVDAYRIPILTLPGYEADDVIGTLVAKSVDAGVNVVVVSGDKDFQQLVKHGVWLLNPGRGGPANVEEHWVGMENAEERLGISPEFVTDYLALVGDSSDNVPGVRGIGDKTATELVKQYGHLESILEHAGEITKKRPREALLELAENARLSKELVTIRDDLPVALDLESLRVKEPDYERLRNLFIELEFHALAKDMAVQAPAEQQKPKLDVNYTTVDTVQELPHAIARARDSKLISIDTETLVDRDNPQMADALRSSLISIAIAVGEGEAYYFPLRHTLSQSGQGELLIDAAGD
ncbi:MAG: 5'-3' exonuclease H3TH domain-containing protein, partial [Thermoanaerobaculia bacterium]